MIFWWCISTTLIKSRVWQLTYVAYVRTSTFVGIRMIVDLRTLTRTLICSLWFFKVLKFQVLIILCLKTYCHLLDHYFNYWSLEETDFLPFTFVLKWPYFSIFNRYFSLSQGTCQYRRSVIKWAKILMRMYVIFIIFL